MKLLSLALFFFMFVTTHVTSMISLQMITVSFPGELPTTMINGKPIRCHCGKAPVEINVLNGIVFAYCEEHLLNA